MDITGVYNPHDPQLTDALAQVQDPIDIAFCCLGTTRREAGSKEAFVHADYTLVVDTALTAKKLGAKHFLGGQRARRERRLAVFFTTGVKGKMEEALIAQKWERLTIARPSMLMGHRDERRFNESFSLRCFAFCRVTGSPSRRGMSRWRC